MKEVIKADAPIPVGSPVGVADFSLPVQAPQLAGLRKPAEDFALFRHAHSSALLGHPFLCDVFRGPLPARKIRRSVPHGEIPAAALYCATRFSGCCEAAPVAATVRGEEFIEAATI
jgi:hypothetical protein